MNTVTSYYHELLPVAAATIWLLLTTDGCQAQISRPYLPFAQDFRVTGALYMGKRKKNSVNIFQFFFC